MASLRMRIEYGPRFFRKLGATVILTESNSQAERFQELGSSGHTAMDTSTTGRGTPTGLTPFECVLGHQPLSVLGMVNLLMCPKWTGGFVGHCGCGKGHMRSSAERLVDSKSKPTGQRCTGVSGT